MSSSTSGAADAADDDAIFEDAKEEVEVDQNEMEVGACIFLYIQFLKRLVMLVICCRKIRMKEMSPATTMWR